MNFKKPFFWDLPKQNIISYLLLPFSITLIIRNCIFNFIKKKIIGNKNNLWEIYISEEQANPPYH